jgi:hypothetical protein
MTPNTTTTPPRPRRGSYEDQLLVCGFAIIPEVFEIAAVWNGTTG